MSDYAVPIQAEWGLTPTRVKRRTLAAEAEVERLREALSFYAASVNYAPQNPPGTGSPIWRDVGRRAREALGAIEEQA